MKKKDDWYILSELIRDLRQDIRKELNMERIPKDMEFIKFQKTSEDNQK